MNWQFVVELFYTAFILLYRRALCARWHCTKFLLPPGLMGGLAPLAPDKLRPCSILQPNNFSMYHICLLILVGACSATALLQHGTPFLSPLTTVCPYIVSSALKVLLYSPAHKQLTHSV